MSILSLIVAVGENGVIGHQGDLPWRLPADLQRFKKRTMGKPILMGRKTHESIGKPLPGRPNWVLTRSSQKVHPDCTVLSGLAEIQERISEEEEVMVIGGAEIYKALLPLAQKLFLTVVHASPKGDTFFPALCEEDWRVVERVFFPADEKNNWAQTELVLERVAQKENHSKDVAPPKKWWSGHET